MESTERLSKEHVISNGDTYSEVNKARSYQISSVQSLSRVPLFATPWTAECQASLSITNSRSPLKLMTIGSVIPSNHLILCRLLLLLSSIFPSIRVFSNESALHFRWPEYWSFSFNISPSNEYSGLISFRMDWLIFQICWHVECSTLITAASFRRPCRAWLMTLLSHASPFTTTRLYSVKGHRGKWGCIFWHSDFKSYIEAIYSFFHPAFIDFLLCSR